MAVQFKGVSQNNGWIPTTWGNAVANTYNSKNPKHAYDVLPISASDPTQGPPSINSYCPLRTMQWSVKREYIGSPSGNSVSTSTRAEPTDVFVQRNVDQVSPYYMQYSFTGMSLANVHLVYPILLPGGTSVTVTWMRLTDAVVTGYFYDTAAQEDKESEGMAVDHYETLTLWYGSINYQSYTTTKGWSALQDSPLGS